MYPLASKIVFMTDRLLFSHIFTLEEISKY